MVKFKDFSMPLSVFQVLCKANFIFKDFSRESYIFKYNSSLCIPCDQLASESVSHKFKEAYFYILSHRQKKGIRW